MIKGISAGFKRCAAERKDEDVESRGEKQTDVPISAEKGEDIGYSKKFEGKGRSKAVRQRKQRFTVTESHGLTVPSWQERRAWPQPRLQMKLLEPWHDHPWHAQAKGFFGKVLVLCLKDSICWSRAGLDTAACT